MTQVLIVEDEPTLLRTLRISLRARHYQVHTAASGAQALRLAATHPMDVVVLDLGLPDMDGTDVVAGLRGWTSVPIVVLSGRSGSADKVAALDAGADDYLTKPFGMDELLARLRAVTRRAAPTDNEPVVNIGEVNVDLTAHRVSRNGHPIHLTPTEWHLLEFLIRNPGKLVSQAQLLAEVWGPGYQSGHGNLRLYIAQLRRKLEPDPARPRHLLNEPGMGYRFEP
ncbi:MAG: response regulator [Dermatophilaceae bacterium]